MKRSTTNHGFTLVELSIVIVIIGLLIGGILVAQSLIRTAELQNVIKWQNYYDMQFRKFKQLYKYRPGDLSNSSSLAFGFGTSWGNQDGLVGYTSTYGGSAGHEQNRSFYQASQAGLLDEMTNNPGLTYHGGTIGENYPNNLFAANSDHFSYRGVCGDIKTNIFVLIAKRKQAEIVTYSGSLLGQSADITPADALALDQKIDDGKPRSGSVWSYAGYDNCANADYSGYDPNKDLSRCLVQFCLSEEKVF